MQQPTGENRREYFGDFFTADLGPWPACMQV